MPGGNRSRTADKECVLLVFIPVTDNRVVVRALGGWAPCSQLPTCYCEAVWHQPSGELRFHQSGVALVRAGPLCNKRLQFPVA